MVEGLLERLAKAFTAARIPYMLIGGQAVLFHGHPRLTQDVDVTLGLDVDAYPRVMSACRTLGLKALVSDPGAFVRTTHVLPLRDTESSIRVDLVFANTPYEQVAIRRARRARVGRAMVAFAAVEDVIIHKLVAARPVDLEDVRVLFTKHGAVLDRRYVRCWLRDFAEAGVLDHDPLRLFDELIGSRRKRA